MTGRGPLGAALAGAALAAAAFALVGLLAPGQARMAAFAPEDCRRILPVDARDGWRLRGIEDMAALPRGRVLLSAADRRAAEAGEAARGGLYLLDRAALSTPSPRVEAVAGLGAGLPHGIDAAGPRIAVVMRRYSEGGHVATDVVAGRLARPGLTGVARWRGADLCAANDVLLAGEQVLASLDRRDCPGLSPRDALAPSGARVLRLGAGGAREVIATGLAHANGLGRLGGALAVAETRAGRLARPGRGGTIGLPGGPDNLTPAPGGGLVAALHPSLWRLALHRHGLAARAPSRIGLVGLRGGVRVLYDDPAGRWFPGATVGLLLAPRGPLLLGGVLAEGLLLCGAHGATGKGTA